MAPRITHTKVSSRPSGSDSGRVYGPDWNADHTISGLTIGTDVQAHDATLDGLAALAGPTGIVAETAADTFGNVTLTGTANRIAVTNGTGAAGNPTFDIDAAYAGQATITTLGTVTTGTWSATTVALAKGGTGQTSAAAARASSGLNVESYTGHGDSIYTILATDKVVGTNAAFTAPRTWTLPAANAVNPGQPLLVADFFGGVTSTNTLVIAKAGSDTINGASSVTMIGSSAAYLLWSDGVSKWSAQATTANSGVASLGGLVGVLGLGTGLTTSGSNIVLNASTVVNSLGADVNLNNTATFFDGPSCAQGTSGTWFASGQITVASSASADTIIAKLWDGTTVIASAVENSVANDFVTIHLSGILTSPAANIKISVKDSTSASGVMRFNASGASKDSTLTAVRIA